MEDVSTSNPQGIKSWSLDDRPREKMISNGAKVLSNAELIAILFGNGTRNKTAVDLARELLQSVGGDLNKLSRLSIKDLQKVNGIGPAKAVTLMAALELFKRRDRLDSDMVKISSSRDAYNVSREYLEDLNVEQFLVVYLARNNKVIHKEIISMGGTSATVVDPKIVFKVALEHLASSVILAHNHPSGSINPSQQDINITNKIKEAAKVMDIYLFDHIIVGDNCYYSFADSGLL